MQHNAAHTRLRSRSHRCNWILNRVILPLVAALASAGPSAYGATDTWTEGDSGSGLFSTAINWTGGNVTPLTNDTLVFGSTAGTTSLTNDLAVNPALGGITFSAAAPAFTLNGAMSLANGAVITANSSSNLTQTINGDFTNLQIAGFSVAGSGNLTMNGAIIRGSTFVPQMTMNGTGVLTLGGAGQLNTVGRFNINSGTVILAKTTAGGIRPDVVLNGGKIILGAANQTLSGLTMAAGTTFDLNGFNQGTNGTSGFSSLVGVGGVITNSGAGTGTNNLFFGVSNQTSYSYFGGTITDGATAKIGVSVTTAGFKGNYVALSGNNTFTGGTTLTQSQTGSSTASVISIAGMQNIGAAGSRNLIFNAATGVSTSALQITGTGINNSSGFDSITFGTSKRSGFDIADATNTFTLSQAVNSGAGGIFTKTGAGTLVMTGAANYTGSTELRGGTLKVDYTSGGVLSNASAPSFSGGSLYLLGNTSGSTSQTLGGVTIGTGGGAIVVDANGGTGTTLALGAVSTFPVAGSALDIKLIGAGNTVTTTGSTVTNGLLGNGRVTLRDNAGNIDFVGLSGTTVQASTYTVGLPASGSTSTANYSQTDNASVTTSETVNALKLGTSTTGQSLAISSGQQLTLTSGSLLFTGANDYAITGGTLVSTTSTDSDLVIHNYGTGNLTVNSVIANGVGASTLTKTGTGTLTLGSTNTFTGATYVNGGKLAITANDQLGAAATGAAMELNGGTLATSGTFALDNAGANKRAILVGGNGGGIEVSSGTLTVSGAIDAAGEITKSGSGVLLLTAANTLNGGVVINDGTLRLGIAGAGGQTSLKLGSSNTPTLQLNGFSMAVNGLVSSNSNAVIESGSATAGTDTITVFNGADNTYAGTLRNGSTRALALAKTGAGTLALSGVNTYTGSTTISNGILSVGSIGDGGVAGNLGQASAAATNLVFSDGTLQYTGANAISNRAFTLTGNTSGTIDTANNLSLVGATGTATNGNLIKTGSGALTLTGVNTYTGSTTVTSGSLVIGASGSLVSGNTLTLEASGTADFANVAQTLGAVSNANTANNALNFSASTGTVTLGSLSGAGNTRFGSDATITSGGISAGTVTTVGLLTTDISGGTVGTGSLSAGTVSGGATTVTGAAGITTQNNGTTTVGGVATIGTLSGGTANLNGATSAITTLSGGTVNLGASTALTVSAGTYAGGVSGGGSLTKAGSGTLTLTGANSYTGSTTVSAGTLSLHAASGAALANTSSLTIDSGATVSLGAASQIAATANLTLAGGTLALGGFNQTLGTLDLSGASTLNFSGTSTLAFADSSALTWSATTLTIRDFHVGASTLRFGTSAGGLTATQLGRFQFVEFGNSAARIDANGFLAPLSLNYSNVGATDLVIDTPITGTTTVTQSGTGSTTLTAPASTPNTSTGLASVTQGTLVIGTAAGGNWAGNVSVSGTGTLKGRGDITGLVTINSAGTYSPGNSPAIQNVGSLTVNSGGFVEIELDGGTAGTGSGFHDQIASTGAVTLNGGTLTASTIFTGSSGYLPTIGAVHAVITGSTVTGKFADYTFDSAANAAGITWLPEYTDTAVNLYSVPSNYATAVAGLNANQAQVGAALQSLRLVGTFELDQRTALDSRATLFNGLKTKDAAGLRTAYDQLTPEKLTALAASTFQSASILNSSLQQRSAELRRFGPASVSLNGVATPAAAEDYRVETVIEDGVHYQIAKAKPKKHYGYFASATGALAAVDGSADRFGSFSQTGAATAGVDYAINENQSVGLVVSQALADTDFSSNSGSSRTTTSRVGLFHDYHNAGFFVNTSVSAGFSTYDTKRNITFLNQTAKGEAQGVSYGGQLSTGYDFKVGDFIVGPTASVAYDHAHIDSFDETGSAAGLKLRRQNADSLVTQLGLHVSRPFFWKRIGWIPDVRLGVSRQSFNPNSITARLAAGGDAFRVNPQAGGSEYINPGASLSALLPNGWTVRLSYDAILNPQSAEHRVNLSINAGF